MELALALALYVYLPYLHVPQAKKGSLSRSGESPYRMPPSNEATIYAEFKKLKIQTIAGFTIE